MAEDVIELVPVPDDERDEKIFKAWKSGKKSINKLSREHDLPPSQIVAILDRHLPSLTPQSQVRELRKVLYDLEELRVAYHEISTKENDPEAANVAVRSAHEISQLRMFVGAQAQRDPVELQRGANPSHTSMGKSLTEALAHLCDTGKIAPENADSIRQLAAHYNRPRESEE